MPTKSEIGLVSDQHAINEPRCASDLAFGTLERMSSALASRKISSTQLIEMHLDRIMRFDSKLHSFVQVFEEEARLAAHAADEMRAAGRAKGPLHGVPVAIKDLFDYAGHLTSAGSLALVSNVATTTATAVRRLEAAGMIVLGKTHMAEFAFGGWGTNPVTGTPWNPWDMKTHRVPGGSSSGSAVAVAAGLIPAALGTDTGGSVRTPACWCGIVGLKTSQGLISRAGVIPLCPTHDTVGPLARSVRDAALLLDTLSGPDPLDRTTLQAPAVSALTDIESGIEGFRIGVLEEAELATVTPEVRGLFDATLGKIESLGTTIENISLPRSVQDYMGDAGDIMSAEGYAHLGHYVDHPDGVVHSVIAERLLRGREISSARYRALLEARRAARAELVARMERIDALMLPTCPNVAIPVAEVDENAPPNVFGRFVNFLDLASLSIPIGFTDLGLPAGLQVVVRRFDDTLALRIGRALEKAIGDLKRRPPGL